MLTRDTTNTNFIVLSLIRLDLELTIYHTQGEQANHYITDAGKAAMIINLASILKYNSDIESH